MWYLPGSEAVSCNNIKFVTINQKDICIST